MLFRSYADDYDAACPDPASAADVVYSYTPSANESITLSLCHTGTNYDTKLFVYQNLCVSDSLVACNDDFCGTI